VPGQFGLLPAIPDKPAASWTLVRILGTLPVWKTSLAALSACHITNVGYLDEGQWLCDVVTRLGALQHLANLGNEQIKPMRRFIPYGYETLHATKVGSVRTWQI
jgi:hypothetical protein